MTLTEAMIDRLCGDPSMTYEERVRYDARQLEVQVKWTGGAIE